MIRHTELRYDFAPLAAAMGEMSFLERARRLGVHPRQLYRYAHQGVTDRVADELAVRLGFVPYAIWPEWLTREPRPIVDWVEEERRRREKRQAAEAERRAAVLAERREWERQERAERARIRCALELPPRPCEWCNVAFSPVSTQQGFHSMACAEASRAARRGVAA